MPDSFEFMSSNVFILTCSSRTILEKYLKPAVSIAEDVKSTDKKAMEKKCQTHFHLARYTDALFRSHEERLDSNGRRIKEQNVAKFISTLAGWNNEKLMVMAHATSIDTATLAFVAVVNQLVVMAKSFVQFNFIFIVRKSYKS